jgi:hypothetical protein
MHSFLGSLGSFHAMNYEPVIRTEEAWNIDTKIDDGHPAYGRLVVPNATEQPNCASSDTAASASYVLTDSRIRCGLIFKTGF